MNASRLVLGVALLSTVLVAPASSVSTEPLVIEEFRADDATWCEIRKEWLADLNANNPPGSWVPMKFEPTDEQLAKLGLPPADVIRSLDLSRPTLVFADGSFEVLDDLPAVEPQVDLVSTAGTVSYAGAGCFGIRPGALLLTVTSNAIGWCTMAHVYGTPGAYSISTAGHCGKTNDIATVIAGTGNRAGATGVVLLDFGKYSKSTGDAGIGKDWALISVNAPWQKLVSPTMCEFGGPIGMYTKSGATVGLTWSRGLPSGVTVNPDPLLVQSIVHYGHGTGVGFPVGSGRVAQVTDWRSSSFVFVGSITPGDSGSGSNTVGGDTIGAHREAAGINTHLYAGTSYYQQFGLGIMAGTRATQVTATLANGQLVPYPAPVPGAP